MGLPPLFKSVIVGLNGRSGMKENTSLSLWGYPGGELTHGLMDCGVAEICQDGSR